MTTTLSPDQVAGTTRVLVIGDDPSVAEAVRRVVVQQNGTGVVIADGRSGLRNFFEERPDLVVLDIGQPGMDGWEVLERIRDLSEVPVLVLTAPELEAGSGTGPHRRCRRLPDQAVRGPGARGPGPGAAAPGPVRPHRPSPRSRPRTATATSRSTGRPARSGSTVRWWA